MSEISFGTAPTSEPPDEDRPWMWVGDRWVEVMTDTADDVPASLDLTEGDDDD